MVDISHILFMGLYALGGFVFLGVLAAVGYFVILKRGGWHGQ